MLPLLAGHAWAANDGPTYKVVGVEFDDVLNIRSGPSNAYPIIAEIPPRGRGVRLTGSCRGWCPVRYHGASGWVYARYLAAEPVVASMFRKLPQLPGYWRVTGVAANEVLKVRDAPSDSAPVVHEFTARDACIALGAGCQKPWCQVKVPARDGDRIGWVHAKFLAPSDVPCDR